MFSHHVDNECWNWNSWYTLQIAPLSHCKSFCRGIITSHCFCLWYSQCDSTSSIPAAFFHLSISHAWQDQYTLLLINTAVQAAWRLALHTRKHDLKHTFTQFSACYYSDCCVGLWVGGVRLHSVPEHIQCTHKYSSEDAATDLPACCSGYTTDVDTVPEKKPLFCATTLHPCSLSEWHCFAGVDSVLPSVLHFNKAIVGFKNFSSKLIFSIKNNCITNSLCQFCPVGVFLCSYYTFLHLLHQKVLAQCFTGMKLEWNSTLTVCFVGLKTRQANSLTHIRYCIRLAPPFLCLSLVH